MRFVKCEVGIDKVFMHYVTKPLSIYDFKAIIDKEEWIYKIVRHADVPYNDKQWRERGTIEIYGHARTIGKIVVWIPVNYRRGKKAKEQTEMIKFPF